MNNIAIFKGTGNPGLAQAICDYMEIPMCNSVVSHFPDGEKMVEVNEDVRGRDCFIIQPTTPPVDSNLMELLIFIECLKRSSVQSITAVIPYFGYARQDRKTRRRTPITARMVADLIYQVGATKLLTLDLHAQQIEGFFSIPVDHLKVLPVFVNYLKKYPNTYENSILLSPDVGNTKTASEYAQELNLELAIVDKRRKNGEEVEALRIVGEVKGKDVLMFDDMISTAGTICSAAEIAKNNGAKKITVLASHGLFSGPAPQRLVESDINKIVVSDTIVPNKSIKDIIENVDNGPEIEIVSVAKLLGEAILRIYQKRSVSVLLKSDYEIFK